MSQFAKDTDVPVERSQAEIQSTLRKYGASRYVSGWDQDRAYIGFEMIGRQIRFILPLPNPQSQEFTHYNAGGSKNKLAERKPHEALRKWEQACRQRWRALNLVIKAKLEAVECGITQFEEEFLAHIVLPGGHGKTAGEYFIPQIAQAYEENKMPPLLPFLEKKG